MFFLLSFYTQTAETPKREENILETSPKQNSILLVRDGILSLLTHTATLTRKHSLTEHYRKQLINAGTRTERGTNLGVTHQIQISSGNIAKFLLVVSRDKLLLIKLFEAPY